MNNGSDPSLSSVVPCRRCSVAHFKQECGEVLGELSARLRSCTAAASADVDAACLRLPALDEELATARDEALASGMLTGDASGAQPDVSSKPAATATATAADTDGARNEIDPAMESAAPGRMPAPQQQEQEAAAAGSSASESDFELLPAAPSRQEPSNALLGRCPACALAFVMLLLRFELSLVLPDGQKIRNPKHSHCS